MAVPPDAPPPFRTEDGTPSAVSVSLLEIKPNDRFMFAHYPENWEMEKIGDVAWWLPQLQFLWLQPGVNNVGTPGRDQPLEDSYAPAIAMLRKKKGKEIPLDVVVPVEKADGSIEHVHKYMRRVACREPRTGRAGHYHLTPWETPIRKRPRQRQKFNMDRDGFNRWRLGLVRAGIVKPPLPGVIDDKLARAKYHVDRQALKTTMGDGAVKRLTDEAEEKAAELAKAKAPTATSATAPANAWDDKTAKELSAIIRSGGADLVLAAIKATDTRRDVLAAIKARKKDLEPATEPSEGGGE